MIALASFHVMGICSVIQAVSAMQFGYAVVLIIGRNC